MKKCKKCGKCKKIMLGLCLGLILGILVFVLLIDSLVKTGIEKGGAYAMGVETKVSKVSVGLTNGQLALDGLSIANPKGFAGDHFLKFDHFGCDLKLTALLSDTIVIKKIELRGAEIALVSDGGSFNYSKILENLEKIGGAEEDKKKEMHKAGAGKSFVINQIVISNVSIRVNLEGMVEQTVKLPDMTLPAIGSESSPAEMAEVAGYVVGRLVEAAVQNAGDILPADVLKDLKSKLNGLKAYEGKIGEIKDLGEKKINEAVTKSKKEIKEQINKQTEKLKKKIDQGIGGLLDGLPR